MENRAIQAIENLEGVIEEKMNDLRQGDHEETKEQGFLQKRLASEKDLDLGQVENAEVQNMLTGPTDAASGLRDEIKQINKRLKKYKKIWRQKEVQISEQARVIGEIGKIEAQFKAINPADLISSDKLIRNLQRKLSRLNEVIRGRRVRTQKKEQALMSQSNYITEIKTGKKYEIMHDRNLPHFTSTFQIKKKIYVCGGTLNINGKDEHVGVFFSVGFTGRCVMLEPIHHRREGVSLSGLPSQLIGIGGWKYVSLKTCETYIVSTNKWVGLPQLNTACQLPGSILLKENRAFCFGGGHRTSIELNSIQCLNLETDGKWKTLPIDYMIPQTYRLAAVDFRNKIVVFGGHETHSYNTLVFSKDGELEQDLSHDPLIPGCLCRGSYTTQNRKIYAMGWNPLRYKWEWRMRAFNGKKWSPV